MQKAESRAVDLPGPYFVPFHLIRKQNLLLCTNITVTNLKEEVRVGAEVEDDNVAVAATRDSLSHGVLSKTIEIKKIIGSEKKIIFNGTVRIYVVQITKIGSCMVTLDRLTQYLKSDVIMKAVNVNNLSEKLKALMVI